MAEYLIQDSTLTNIANSIRSKTGKTDPILTENMATEIDGISGGGGEKVTLSNYSAGRPFTLNGFFISENIKELSVDLGNTTADIQRIRFLCAGGGILNIKNLSVTDKGDLCRQIDNATEINFTPSISPSSLWRFLYNINFYDVKLLKVTGISLKKVTSISGIGTSSRVTDIYWEDELENNFDFHDNTGIAPRTIKDLIGRLKDYSNGEPHILTLGATFKAMLTEEELQNAAAKNWTVG